MCVCVYVCMYYVRAKIARFPHGLFKVVFIAQTVYHRPIKLVVNKEFERTSKKHCALILGSNPIYVWVGGLRKITENLSGYLITETRFKLGTLLMRNKATDNCTETFG